MEKKLSENEKYKNISSYNNDTVFNNYNRTSTINLFKC